MVDAQPPSPIGEETAGRATLVVCEYSGQWAHKLRLLLDDAPADNPTEADSSRAHKPRIVETRSTAECLDALCTFPAAFVAIELTEGNCDATLDLLATLNARRPDARAAVVAARSMRPYRWLLHELGAVCLVFSPWQLPVLAEMARRHGDGLPRPADLAEEIWEQLPWQARPSGTT